jgi:hypothetical protein
VITQLFCKIYRKHRNTLKKKEANCEKVERRERERAQSGIKRSNKEPKSQKPRTSIAAGAAIAAMV